MLTVRVEGENDIVSLTAEIGSGGGGTVYAHPSRPDRLIKIWHRPDERERRKLATILESPPQATVAGVQIANPLNTVLSVASDEAIGLVMPTANGVTFATVCNPSSRPLGWQFYKPRLELAGKLARTVRSLNDQGAILLDGLAPTNILVGPEVWLIDVDGWQFSTGGIVHHAEAFQWEISPPEVLNTDIAKQTLNETHDAWALATAIFWLLTGHHPFDAKPKSPTAPKLKERIPIGCSPYARRGRKAGLSPHPGAPLALLHPSMQRLVVQCFDAGAFTPAARPTASEWSAAIQKALGDQAFLKKVVSVEADAARRRTAARKPKSGRKGQKQTAKHRTKKKGGYWLAVAGIGAMLLIGGLTGWYLLMDSDDDEPELVMPTYEAHEGERLPTPRLWKRLAQPDYAEKRPFRSREPDTHEPDVPAQSAWDRLNSPVLKRK